MKVKLVALLGLCFLLCAPAVSAEPMGTLQSQDHQLEIADTVALWSEHDSTLTLHFFPYALSEQERQWVWQTRATFPLMMDKKGLYGSLSLKFRQGRWLSQEAFAFGGHRMELTFFPENLQVEAVSFGESEDEIRASIQNFVVTNQEDQVRLILQAQGKRVLPNKDQVFWDLDIQIPLQGIASNRIPMELAEQATQREQSTRARGFLRKGGNNLTIKDAFCVWNPEKARLVTYFLPFVLTEEEKTTLQANTEYVMHHLRHRNADRAKPFPYGELVQYFEPGKDPVLSTMKHYYFIWVYIDPVAKTDNITISGNLARNHFGKLEIDLNAAHVEMQFVPDANTAASYKWDVNLETDLYRAR